MRLPWVAVAAMFVAACGSDTDATTVAAPPDATSAETSAGLPEGCKGEPVQRVSVDGIWGGERKASVEEAIQRGVSRYFPAYPDSAAELVDQVDFGNSERAETAMSGSLDLSGAGYEIGATVHLERYDDEWVATSFEACDSFGREYAPVVKPDETATTIEYDIEAKDEAP
jgi:hypothetical protein